MPSKPGYVFPKILCTPPIYNVGESGRSSNSKVDVRETADWNSKPVTIFGFISECSKRSFAINRPLSKDRPLPH